MNREVIPTVEAGGEETPVAWIRFRSDGGVEGPLMDSQIEDVRKRSGAWTPLFTRPTKAAAAGVPSNEQTFELLGAMHAFLEWNRAQPAPPVRIAYEYGVFEKAIELASPAAPAGAPTDEVTR
jgi:hypothetical protein